MYAFSDTEDPPKNLIRVIVREQTRNFAEGKKLSHMSRTVMSKGKRKRDEDE
jgi:hypothetical protein